MAYIKSALLFGLLSVTAYAQPNKRAVCSAGRRTVTGNTYTISCGIDRPGNDYNRLQTTLDGCLSACNADSKCTTAQYDEDNKFCYLKSAVNDAVIKSGIDTIDHGKACKRDATVTFSGTQCKISCGMDRPGNDYSEMYTGNYLACAQACAADTKCATAQYKEDNGFCYLKNAVNSAVASDTVDSIVCARSSSSVTSSTVTKTSSSTSSSSASSTKSSSAIASSATTTK